MGCDIHAMVERKHLNWEGKPSQGWWCNAGDPDIGRNYAIFSVLADVRNINGIPVISQPKGLPEDACSPMEAWHARWEGDAHSASYLTLTELKAFDVHQKYFCTRWVRRDASGEQVETFASSSDESSMTEQVGEIEIFEEFAGGTSRWLSIIDYMSACKLPGYTDNDVRLVFFFDN